LFQDEANQALARLASDWRRLAVSAGRAGDAAVEDVMGARPAVDAQGSEQGNALPETARRVKK